MSPSGLAGKTRVGIKTRGWEILLNDTPVITRAPGATGCTPKPLASALRLPRFTSGSTPFYQVVLKKRLTFGTSVTSSVKERGEGCRLLEFVVLFIIWNQGPQNS